MTIDEQNEEFDGFTSRYVCLCFRIIFLVSIFFFVVVNIVHCLMCARALWHYTHFLVANSFHFPPCASHSFIHTLSKLLHLFPFWVFISTPGELGHHTRHIATSNRSRPFYFWRGYLITKQDINEKKRSFRPLSVVFVVVVEMISMMSIYVLTICATWNTTDVCLMMGGNKAREGSVH